MIPEQILEGTKSVAILGHIRPGGDRLGPALGLYNYLRLNHPDIWATVYLEGPSLKFNYPKGYGKVRHQVDDMCYEFCVCLDSGDIQHLGNFKHHLDQADKGLCLGHRVTDTYYGGTNAIPDEVSSICEILFDQLNEEKIDHHTAGCLYTDIIHDTGVFKFSCTSAHTMGIAGKLMKEGTDFGVIIDSSFYREVYTQNQTPDRVLLESIAFFDGWCILSAIRQSEMEFYGVDSKDLNGIIGQLRLAKGVKVAIFIYEIDIQEFKVSMRPRYLAGVSRIAVFFGGGGHVRAAGCTMSDSIHDVINNLSVRIAGQLDVVPDSQK